MLLFYLSASRADANVTLSYLESDASGKGGAAGSFLLSLLAPFGGLDGAADAGKLERILPGRFLPDPAELADPRDAVIAAVAGLFRNDVGHSAGALRWAVTNRPDQLARAAAGLWARHRRWSREPCDAFDGRISDADLLTKLDDRFGENAVFSASSFNSFGQCPWQYFASHVLRLAPLDEPQRRIEAVSRGLFCHAVLFRTMTRLRDETGEPVDLAAVPAEQITAALDDAMAAEAERVERTRPPYPVFWRIQCERMRKEMSDYLLTFRDKAAPGARSTHFELAFGQRRGDDPVDPASSTEPVVLPTPAGRLRLRGKIDRVDWVEAEDGDGMLVVDYKTGGLPTQADMNAGRNLQAPLYAAAAETILHRDALGGAFHGIARRTVTHFSALRSPRGDDRTFAQRMTDAMATAGAFATAMRGGRFDVLPTHKCPSWCPYRRICHYADARADLKRPCCEEGDE
jgi:RecB family exonuclease